MTLPVQARSLRGCVSLKGDKSLAHRAALFAALADGESVIGNFPSTGVSRAMLSALASLGIRSSLEGETLKVEGLGFRPFPSGGIVDCRNSGTTMRLLAGAIAGTGSEAVLDGSVGLRLRPMGRVADPLSAMGAKISTADGRAPMEIRKGAYPLKAIDWTLPVASAQVKSAIILAALGADGESSVREPGPGRDHTELMLRSMGAGIESFGGTVRIKPLVSPLKPLSGDLPGDISSAAFILVAAAIVSGSEIEISDVLLNPTRTGVIDVLSRMGALVEINPTGERFGETVGKVSLRARPLKGIEIGGDLVVRAIDEFPAIAVAASFAEGETIVRDAKELRFKETDRIDAIVSKLSSLGVKARGFEDGFAIEGGTLKGGTVDASGDHRLAMSMALAGLRARVTVRNAQILDESFPDFQVMLENLGVGL